MFMFNDASVQQMSIFDFCSNLTEREKRYLDNSWAKYFAEHIFPKIDEKPYAVLYSEKDSRPNTPVNVIIGALIIKELTTQSDDELLESMMFDIRIQYALHTTSFQEQPMSDRTLGRFRALCAKYEKETGIDLIQNTLKSLSAGMAELMGLSLSFKRMDSMMVASNIKRMGRLELLYTCVANLANELDKYGEELPEGLQHYTQANDRNLVIYHNRSEDAEAKISIILKDAATLKELCEGRYEESSDYRLLLRALKEQTIENEDGTLRLRTKADGGMDGSILQSPADPDATYREKAGKQHRGYVANVVEVAGEGGSIVMDYQYEQNIYSDSQFMKDFLEREGTQSEETTVVTDGAYAGKENEDLAKEKNVKLETTNLTGREAEDIAADFIFNEDGTRVEKCAGGYAPKSCSYSARTGQCTATFQRCDCEQCPYKEKCNPKVHQKTCTKRISVKTKRRAEQQRRRKSDEFKKLSAFRNGVETIPSILRRKYHVDRMPVRGRIRSKMFFGFKLGALNFKKFCKFLDEGDKYAHSGDYYAQMTITA